MFDSFANYGAVALLTPEEELFLGKKIKIGQSDDATPRQKKEAEKAVNKLMAHNVRLVMTVARPFIPRCKHLHFEDLVQEGILGLRSAATKFDYTRGYKFSTYAYWWIRQSIHRAVVNQDRAIRWPAHITEQICKLRREGDPLKTLTGSHGCHELLCSAARTDHVSSLNAYLFRGENELELQDVLSEPEKTETFADIIGIDDLDGIMRKQLTEQEYKAICLHYGFMGKEHSYGEISSKLNCSKNAIGSIVRGAERKLLLHLTVNGIHP